MINLWWLVPCVCMILADQVDRRRWRREAEAAAIAAKRRPAPDRLYYIAIRACSGVIYDSGRQLPDHLGPPGQA